MEDNLLLYINFLKGWKEKYILVYDELLYILSEKGGIQEGLIHLQIATMKVHDTVTMEIDSGLTKILLKFRTNKQLTQWIAIIK